MIVTRWFRSGFAPLLLSLVLVVCTHPRKQVTAPPQAAPQPRQKQNLFVLLPEPDGKASGISVTNAAGAQTITQPYQAVRVERSDVAPTPAFAIDEAEVRRVFGTVLDAIPAAETAFILHFAEDSDMLDAEAQTQLTIIMNTIRERHSTAISLIGHTDTTGAPQSNYQLGLRRAQGVAAVLRRQGVNAEDLFIESHGEADLLVKTGRGVNERLNRRVEVVVR